MDVLSTLALFVFGFFVLVKGAKYLIKGASSIARLFKVSGWVVGVVIVGIGSSIPELSINIASVFQNANVGLSAIIGSNIFNILAILGLVAIISPISINKGWLQKDFLINFLAVLVSGIFLLFPILGGDFLGISRPEGFILFLLFIAWLYFMVRRKKDDEEEDKEYKSSTIFISILMIVAGIVGVFLGGQWVVSGAELIALFLKVPESIVGLTVVALGTSISELTISVRAALERKNSLALGNIVGSNIFDFLGILGIASFFGKIPFPPILLFDLAAVLVVTLLLPLVVLLNKNLQISRAQGFIFLALYLLYFSLALVRA